MTVIQGKILEGSTIHTDGWTAYDGLILNGYDHYHTNVFMEKTQSKHHLIFLEFCEKKASEINISCLAFERM